MSDEEKRRLERELKSSGQLTPRDRVRLLTLKHQAGELEPRKQSSIPIEKPASYRRYQQRYISNASTEPQTVKEKQARLLNVRDNIRILNLMDRRNFQASPNWTSKITYDDDSREKDKLRKELKILRTAKRLGITDLKDISQIKENDERLQSLIRKYKLEPLNDRERSEYKRLIKPRLAEKYPKPRVQTTLPVRARDKWISGDGPGDKESVRKLQRYPTYDKLSDENKKRLQNVDDRRIANWGIARLLRDITTGYSLANFSGMNKDLKDQIRKRALLRQDSRILRKQLHDKKRINESDERFRELERKEKIGDLSPREKQEYGRMILQNPSQVSEPIRLTRHTDKPLNKNQHKEILTSTDPNWKRNLYLKFQNRYEKSNNPVEKSIIGHLIDRQGKRASKLFFRDLVSRTIDNPRSRKGDKGEESFRQAEIDTLRRKLKVLKKLHRLGIKDVPPGYESHYLELD